MSSFKHKKTSKVWDIFKPIDKGLAKCNMCSAKLSYRTTITNLRKHIRCKHPTVDLRYLSQRQSNNGMKHEYSMEDEVEEDEESFLPYPKLYEINSPESTRRSRSPAIVRSAEEDVESRASVVNAKARRENATIVFEHIDPVSNRTTTTAQSTVLSETLANAIRSADIKYSNDVEAFGEHIKAEMNKITNEELRDEAMHNINTTLFEIKKKQRLINTEE